MLTPRNNSEVRLENRAVTSRGTTARASSPTRQEQSAFRSDPVGSPFRGVKWSLAYGSFLLYLLVITSYRLPVGDVAIALALLGLFFLPGGIRVPTHVRWLAVFTAWVWIASSFSAYPEVVALRRMDLLKLWLIVLIAVNALRTRQQIRLFMVFYLVCFVLFPLRGAMITFFVYGDNIQGRAAWIRLYSNPNDLAAMCLLLISMAAVLVVSEPKGWVRRGAQGALVGLPLLLVMTQSRGAFLAFLVFLSIVIAGQGRRLVLLTRIVAVAAVLAMVAPPEVWDRFGSLRNATSTENLSAVDGEEGSTRQRYEIWQVGLKIIADHPVTGVGIGAYPYNHERYSLRQEFNPTAWGARDTHSLYLNVIAETGYPGLLLYLGMIGAVLIPAERARRRCKNRLPVAARQLLLLEAGLVAFMTHCIFGTLPYLAHLHLHLVLITVMIALYKKELDNAVGDGALRPTEVQRRRALRQPVSRPSAFGVAGSIPPRGLA
jgi:probable O-glycosylation ligase (exosortase A-associated)